MIKEIRTENYKSIQKLKLNPGRITVLIGENGCGKSNILEAIALSSATSQDKLDNEFLVSRGIRVTEPQFMRAAFDKENVAKAIRISLATDRLESDLTCVLQNNNQPYSKWENIEFPDFKKDAKKHLAKAVYADYISEFIGLDRFLIYSPENLSLCTFEKEGQIQPLGIHGEGLFKLLRVMSSYGNKERLDEIKEKLRVIDWFGDFEIPQNLFGGERQVQIMDRYLDEDLDEDLACFDQKSSNEGFLFLLFYFALFISDDTPSFFAIDNIDASLNPKLCRRLIKDLVALAEEHDKQAILTTHNPAVLDGLNLDDDEQRLFVIYRNQLGHTKAKRILKPQPIDGQQPIKMSEAFLRGYIGGLPKNF